MNPNYHPITPWTTNIRAIDESYIYIFKNPIYVVKFAENLRLESHQPTNGKIFEF